jgi:site-specific recombinase XerD
MTSIRLKYVNEYVDRWGKVRRYFRRGGRNVGPLPGEPGSEEFMAAYAAYLGGRTVKPSAPAPHADSLSKLATEYYLHPMFTQRKPNTRKLYRSALERVVSEHGHRSVALMTIEHAEKIIHKIGAETPAMANLTLSVMRRVMSLAVKRRLRETNPFEYVEGYEGGEHHTWTDAELRQYERKWPLGTRQRLAYALALFTDQRVGDIAKMRRSDVAGGSIHVVQEKNGAELWVPIHPELERAMAAGPNKGLTLVGDKNGRPITGKALSDFLSDAIDGAGLPERCVAHGLRKALQRILAEHGATAKEMQAMSGHKTLKETQRYTKAADQRRLALAAIARLPSRIGEAS